jgi:REP element-mobilizing transposase RayT
MTEHVAVRATPPGFDYRVDVLGFAPQAIACHASGVPNHATPPAFRTMPRLRCPIYFGMEKSPFAIKSCCMPNFHSRQSIQPEFSVRNFKGIANMPSSHSAIYLHVVFSTKQRYPYLKTEGRDSLFGYIGGTLQEHKSVLLRAGGVEDHVHLLISVHPAYAISDTVRLIKANSSRWINENNQCKARFEWQRGFGVFSVSHSQLSKLIQYIDNQVAHHEKVSFKDEYLKLLRLHEVVFDERYVFEDEIVG